MRMDNTEKQEPIQPKAVSIHISYEIFNQFLFQYHNKKTRSSALSNLFKSLDSNCDKLSEPLVSLIVALAVTFAKAYDKAWSWQKHQAITDALVKFKNSLDL